MSNEVERSSKHELKAEAAAPDWLGQFGLKLGGSYAYTRESRVKQLVDDAAAYASTDEDGIADRASGDAEFGDILLRAGRRASETADPGLRDVLARLVAGAFEDDARVGTWHYLLGLATSQLEPVHLRVISAIDPAGESQTAEVENQVNADPGLTSASLSRLQSIGLVSTEDGRGYGSPARGWQLTDLGRKLVELVEETRDQSSHKD